MDDVSTPLQAELDQWIMARRARKAAGEKMDHTALMLDVINQFKLDTEQDGVLQAAALLAALLERAINEPMISMPDL